MKGFFESIFEKEINTLNLRTQEDAVKTGENISYTALVLDLTSGNL